MDLERRRLRWERLVGIEVMGSDPRHAAQEGDREERDGPDKELEAAGGLKIRQVGRPRVEGPKPPGEGQRRGDPPNPAGVLDNPPPHTQPLRARPIRPLPTQSPP